MQVSIHKIILEDRIRKDLGDLNPLMSSMQKHGQLNPVVIDEESRLIAGHRRLESAKQLGWLTVETICLKNLSSSDKLELEIDENIHRKELTPEEVKDGHERLEKLNKPPVINRIGLFFRNLWAKLFHRKPKKDLTINEETN
jgi:ParB family chromosome partitioning protein